MKGNLYLDSQDFEDGINWNPHSNYYEEQLNIVNQSAEELEPIESQKKRPSHKNKYINKITLIKPEETANTKKRHFIQNQVSIHPEQIKKIKNREAAKESRQRKKLYINLVEDHTKKLQKELENTNKQIENTKIEIQKSTFNNNQSIGAFDSKMVHIYHKMENLITIDECDEKNNELNLAIDSMIYRFGATGKERKNNINESYKQIISLAPPSMHRYFLWAAREKVHLFEANDSYNEEYQDWFSEMRKMIGESLAKNDVLLQSKREEIIGNLNNISRLITHFRQAKEQVENFCNILDNLFLQVRQILTPLQSAKLILVIQKYKYRQQLRYLQHENAEEQLELLHSPQKHLKIQEQH